MAAPLYFPEDHGADCANCYLREHRAGLPVGPEINAGSLAIVIGEAPGEVEVDEGKPFAGKSGVELGVGLAAHGIRRSGVSYSNALCCRPPENELELLLHKFQRENKKREKAGLAKKPDPFTCCRPRLLKDLQGFANIIAVGKTAASAVLGHPVSIMEIRGGPMTLADSRKVMPTVHPAFVMRMRRWTRAFRADLGRAVRWFRGQLEYRQPKITMNPSPAMLRAFLTSHPAYAYDTETKSPLKGRPELAKDPLMAKLGLIGFATADEVMVVAFLGVDGESKFYTDAEYRELKEIICEWATDQRILHIDFNGYYDVPILKHNLGVVVVNRWDNILAHRNVEPELPHGLGYVASVYTEIPSAWKVDHAGTDAETDAEWREYNATDCTLTFRVTPALNEAIAVRGAGTALAMHHAIQRYCIGMHENGLWVNEAARAKWDVQLRAEAVTHLKALKSALLDTGLTPDFVHDFNPGSVEQLKDLFFTRWQLLPVDYSKKTGEPSTGDLTIREWLRDPKIRPSMKSALTALRRLRATTKTRGTYVRRMVSFLQVVPKDPLSTEDDDDETTRDEALARKIRRTKKGAKKETYGLVLNDGRVHPNFNAHSVATGWRLSSNDPNAQNWMRKIRDIIAPQWCVTDFIIEESKKGNWKFANGTPFRVFAYADQDQGEMRIIAAFAKIGKLLEAFKTKKDPHAVNAEAYFGDVFVKANKTPVAGTSQSDWDRLRDFSKTIFYAMAYWASFDTVYETITSAEDANGNLPFVNYTQRHVRAIVDRFMLQTPELEIWWNTEMELYRKQGFLTDPLFGYRCDFLDGEDKNKIVNFRAQATLGAIVQKAAVQLVDGPGAPLHPGVYGHGTGIVNNGHDRLDFELPVFHERRYVEKDKKGKEKWNVGWCVPGAKCCPLELHRQQITEAMHQRVPTLDVDFTGEAKVILGAWV